MSSAIARSTPSLTLPPTQNTAPVLEFRCLYTHDIRRKSKRWQDGYLKYHTFNRRVMVYDASRNFIGDMHWRESGDLQDGEELTLERSGALVQVGEAVGTTETDLTPLFQRKGKETPEKVSGYETATSPALSVRATAPLAPSQLKHKSLNALLGTPKGPYGKAALPTKSPYEARHDRDENVWVEGRAAKRQRIDNARPAQIRGGTETLGRSKRISWEQPLWAKTSDAHNANIAPESGTGAKAALSPEQELPFQQGIEISSDTEDAPSDATLPVKPPEKPKPISSASRAPKARKPAVPSSPPTNAASAREKSQLAQAETRRREGVTHRGPSAPLSKDHRVKLLRPAATVPRKTLLCLQSSAPRPNTATNRRTSNNMPMEVPSDESDALTQLTRAYKKSAVEKPNRDGSKAQRDHATARIIKTDRYRSPNSEASNTNDATTDTAALSSSPRRGQHPVVLKPSSQFVPSSAIQRRTPTVESDATVTVPEEMAHAHGRMDQQLLVPSVIPRAIPRIANAELQSRPSRLSQAASRPFRRVYSENDTPGLVGCNSAGPRDTANEASEAVPSRLGSSKEKKGQVFKSQFQRSRSLSGASMPPVTTTDVARVAKQNAPDTSEPVKDTDVGPWSTEAFDLLDWRPPDRDVNGNKVTRSEETDRTVGTSH